MNFDGKVVLVTGASSGIGAATAEVFAQRGANVVLVGRNAEKLEKSAAKCKAANGKVEVLAINADVTKDSERIMKETLNKFKKLDVLVNNAGIASLKQFMTSDISELDTLWDTNLRAVHILTKLAVPSLLETKGNIVNVSSVAGLRSYAWAVNYCITKAALDQFTKCLAQELAPKGIRVNAVNPATIQTDLHENMGASKELAEAHYKEAVKLHPVGRTGTVYEVANSIAFLASDEASFITGTLLAVDGGRATAAV